MCDNECLPQSACTSVVIKSVLLHTSSSFQSVQAYRPNNLLACNTIYTTSYSSCLCKTLREKTTKITKATVPIQYNNNFEPTLQHH